MSSTDSLSLLEVDNRLEVLQHNLQCLQKVSAVLSESAYNPLPFVSLTQAFYDESKTLDAACNGTPDDRYAALDHTMSNIATIRSEADDDVIAALDNAVDGMLRTWD